MIEWHILNCSIWISDPIKKLLQSHLHIQWGDTKKAYTMADGVQKKAEADARITLARLALELKSGVVQSVFQESASEHLQLMYQEVERLTGQSYKHATITSAYVQAAVLAEQSMLLRTDEQKKKLQTLSAKLKEIDQRNKELNFQLWAYRVQAESYLEMVKGNIQGSFDLLHQLWLRMTTDPYPIPIEEHRFYQFFQTYTSAALRAEQWNKTKRATGLYQTAIDKYYGDDHRRKALAHTFLTLADVGSLDTHSSSSVGQLKNLLKLFIGRTENEFGNFNLRDWELHVSADILPLLLKNGFEKRLFPECNSLMSLIATFKLKKANIATDLILIAPLLQQVILFEMYSEQRISVQQTDFINGADRCYELYRKRKDTYPVEWELARLFRTLALNSKKTQTDHFIKCIQRIDAIRPNCLYYKGLMQLFDFDTWLRTKV
ncbi:MAG: hypothetical protein H6603_01295 [Flavobacteriales bacterium]|nr:hypothetical protein [Flavobacteriales bacterium]MCB9203585.1 hypothetical protein [Flavobacteriales bacterium]